MCSKWLQPGSRPGPCRALVLHRDLHSCGKGPGCKRLVRRTGGTLVWVSSYHSPGAASTVRGVEGRRGIDSPACCGYPRRFGRRGVPRQRPLVRARGTRSHEAHFPTEQPTPAAHPRLSRAHADQGRAPRSEAAPPEGAQARRDALASGSGGGGSRSAPMGAPAAPSRVSRRLQAGPACVRPAVPPARAPERPRLVAARDGRRPRVRRRRHAQPGAAPDPRRLQAAAVQPPRPGRRGRGPAGAARVPAGRRRA